MAVTRIPANQTSAFSSWSAPEVKEGQVVHVEKLNKRGPRGELVNVDKQDVIYQSITAGQLEEISNQAYEEVRQQAYQDGLKQGHEEGRQAGLKAGQAAIELQVADMKRAITELYRYLSDQDDELEQALVNMATCVAKAILQRELNADSSHVQRVVHEALAVLPLDSHNISIHLSEQDYQSLTQLSDTPEQWQLQIDRTLSAGGCRVQSQHSVVNFTLEEQFQQTVNQLVEARFAELSSQAKERTQQRDDDSSERT